MLYLIVDSIAEFLGSHFRCNNYPIIYVLIRTIVLGLFNFFVSTIYVYFESDDFGTDNIVFNFFNFFNALLMGAITSVLIFLWDKFVDFIDGFF